MCNFQTVDSNIYDTKSTEQKQSIYTTYCLTGNYSHSSIFWKLLASAIVVDCKTTSIKESLDAIYAWSRDWQLFHTRNTH